MNRTANIMLTKANALVAKYTSIILNKATTLLRRLEFNRHLVDAAVELEAYRPHRLTRSAAGYQPLRPLLLCAASLQQFLKHLIE